MGKYIDYKTFNPIYAPGLSTYASKGEKGDSGTNGTAVYYNKNSIKRNQSERDFVDQKIANNELLTSSTSESNNVVVYKPFDLVIDSDGDVYYIINDGGVCKLGTSIIGNISASIRKNYQITTSGASFTLTSLLADTSQRDRYRYNITYYYIDGETQVNKVEYLHLADGQAFDTGVGSPITILQVEVMDRETGKTAIFPETED